MIGKTHRIAVLAAIGSIAIGSTTQHEKPVVGDATTTANRSRIGALEADLARSPDEPRALRALAEAYLEARQPGLAIAAIERASDEARTDPGLEHVYARALLEQGRSADALAAEKRVLERCSDAPSGDERCSSYLVASATHRATIFHQLVQLGVEDARAQPEAALVAYQSATRPVSLAVSSGSRLD